MIAKLPAWFHASGHHATAELAKAREQLRDVVAYYGTDRVSVWFSDPTILLMIGTRTVWVDPNAPDQRKNSGYLQALVGMVKSGQLTPSISLGIGGVEPLRFDLVATAKFYAPRRAEPKGVAKQEAEVLVRDWLVKHAPTNPSSITRDAIAKGCGISAGAVSQSASWKAFRDRRDVNKKPKGRAKSLSLSTEILAVVPSHTSQPDELALLIEEQKQEQQRDARVVTRRSHSHRHVGTVTK